MRFISITLLLAATLAHATPEAGFPVATGKFFRDAPGAPQLVVVPPGSYVMGATAEESSREGRGKDSAAWERPQHRVVLTTPLAVGRYLVTRQEFAAFVAATNRPVTQGCNVIDQGKWQDEPGRSFADPAFAQTDKDPAVCVGFDDAQAYAAWLTQTTHHHYRLLHEAEWEYAARGGSTGSRWWGDDRSALCSRVNGGDLSYHALQPADSHANTTCDDRFVNTNPGGAFAPNPFGLSDALGNVWQWTADCFSPGYDNAPTLASTPVETGDCSRRMIRGGSWHNSPDALRSAARFWLPPAMHSSSLGFRVARTLDAVP